MIAGGPALNVPLKTDCQPCCYVQPRNLVGYFPQFLFYNFEQLNHRYPVRFIFEPHTAIVLVGQFLCSFLVWSQSIHLCVSWTHLFQVRYQFVVGDSLKTGGKNGNRSWIISLVPEGEDAYIYNEVKCLDWWDHFPIYARIQEGESAGNLFHREEKKLTGWSPKTEAQNFESKKKKVMENGEDKRKPPRPPLLKWRTTRNLKDRKIYNAHQTMWGARCTRVMKRRVLKKQGRKDWAKHLVQCCLARVWTGIHGGQWRMAKRAAEALWRSVHRSGGHERSARKQNWIRQKKRDQQFTIDGRKAEITVGPVLQARKRNDQAVSLGEDLHFYEVLSGSLPGPDGILDLCSCGNRTRTEPSRWHLQEEWPPTLKQGCVTRPTVYLASLDIKTAFDEARPRHVSKNTENHDAYGWLIVALMREMSRLEGKAMFDCVECSFAFNRCLRQGGIEAPRLWQKMAM